MRVRTLALLALLAVGLTPGTARADWFLIPFGGAAFGGSTNDTQVNWGASFGFMGGGIFGLEVDFSYTPNFFDTSGDDIFDDDFFLDLIEDTNVTTVMANLVIGVPIGGTSGPGFRPYVSAGGGLMRTNIAAFGDIFDLGDITANDFGVNVGGGAMGFFADHIGLRGDLRYFRSLQENPFDALFDDDEEDILGDLDFWRGTVGLVIRF